MSPFDRFPELTVAGDARARGIVYGRAFRDRIAATWAFYSARVFAASPLDAAAIEARAATVRELIGDFEPTYCAEIEGMAEGAGLPAWQLYCLNARTEILNAAVGECTALWFARSRTLGQTWDWLSALEDLCVITTFVRPDGHRVLTFAEPGMLAKIGLNDRGVGVCLNFLVAAHALDGLPVHVLQRAILDCADLAEARAVVARAGFGKASHVLIADGEGRAASFEFQGTGCRELPVTAAVFAHTNHCLAGTAPGFVIPTSPERLARAYATADGTEAHGVGPMQAALGTADGTTGSISVAYRPEPLLGGGDVGTCAAIVMDLPARLMHVRKGPDPARPFHPITACAPRAAHRAAAAGPVEPGLARRPRAP